MDIWQSLPESLPADGETVWVRVSNWYGQPFQATWSLSSHQFTSVVNSIVYPAWSVMRWRSL